MGEIKQGEGASADADRATHEPSRSVSALRVGIASALLSIAMLSGCARYAGDPPVSEEMEAKIRKIATGNNLDARFARVVMADGHATVREVQVWLDESDAVDRQDAPESPSQ